jgi:hypothetical protein
MLPSGICRLKMTCCSPHLITSWILILLLTIFVLQVTNSLQDFSAISTLKSANGKIMLVALPNHAQNVFNNLYMLL